MRRDIDRLSCTAYDLIVVGGGIHGACAAWDAALRGLRVALVEKGDFGAAASANSLKILHGGLRYLQSGDIRRVRQSAREQSIFGRIAPHLVRPLPCLLPTHGSGMRSRAALSIALRAYALASEGGRRGTQTSHPLPPGRILSRSECLELAPSLHGLRFDGGALWHELLAWNAERLTLAFVLSAAERGADAANYLRVDRILSRGGMAHGVGATDLLTGFAVEIRARAVLIAAGTWTPEIAASIVPSAPPIDSTALAMNLVADPLPDRVALGIRVLEVPEGIAGEGRTLFFAPWRGVTMIGTSYRLHAGGSDEAVVDPADIDRLVAAANRSLPALDLTIDRLRYIHRGLLPLEESRGVGRPRRLARRHRVIDHGELDGGRGIFSLVGVKYTTARLAAEEAIDRICQSLGRDAGKSRTSDTPLHGAKGAAPTDPGVGPIEARLWEEHGCRTRDLIAAGAGDQDWTGPIAPGSKLLRCQVLHAVREEMALHLPDLVFRRTTLGAGGMPAAEEVGAASRLMAEELGWNDVRRRAEIEAVAAVFAPLRRGAGGGHA